MTENVNKTAKFLEAHFREGLKKSRKRWKETITVAYDKIAWRIWFIYTCHGCVKSMIMKKIRERELLK